MGGATLKCLVIGGSMSRSLSAVAIVVGACFVLVGCGGDDVNCSFTACGGDPVGNWSIEGMCFDADDLLDQSSCPQATASASVDISGSVSILADSTYTSQTSSVTSFITTIPAECLMGLMSCDQLTNPDTGTMCSGDASDACDCTGSDSQSDTSSGTWSASGNTLTLDNDPAEYCVSGNTMKVRTIPQAADDIVTTIVMSRN
jgi:hypothetical protein